MLLFIAFISLKFDYIRIFFIENNIKIYHLLYVCYYLFCDYYLMCDIRN